GLVEQLVEMADSRSSARLDRTGRDGVDADSLGPELTGEIAHGALQSGLDGTHHIVMLDDFLGAVIAHREKGAALLHQRLRQPCHAYEGVARDVHGQKES